MTIRIDSRTTPIGFPTTAPVKEGAPRPTTEEVAQARAAIVAQNQQAARASSISNAETAAGIAALLRKSIANQAGAAMQAQANFDPQRIIALLD
ncbi:MAG: hypothetical protein FJZ01_26645 [Candidatus Sericytochromatia bacterium]|nr:hypothetical protein [Candidatus Tanganyikabacteria bacterium]